MIGHHLRRFSSTKEDWLGSRRPLGNISRRTKGGTLDFLPAARMCALSGYGKPIWKHHKYRLILDVVQSWVFDTDSSLALTFLSTTQVKTLLKAGIWPSPVAP